MFYPNHHIRTYCVYLGSFELGNIKMDFGVYEHNDEVSHAIVFGNEDSEYMSGEFIFDGKLLAPEYRFKSLRAQMNERLYQEYLDDPKSFPHPKRS